MYIPQTLRVLFEGKKTLVVGLGNQGGGSGTARFLSRLGAIVTITDTKNDNQLKEGLEKLFDIPVVLHLGHHDENDFINADIIIKGPSVPWDLPEIQKAKDKGIPIFLEAALFVKYSPVSIIGVTGTRGKSTTTEMIANILTTNGKKVLKGGNIPGKSTLELFDIPEEPDYIVLELSSFQLSGFHTLKISPEIAVMTNFFPDHLNHYHSMDAYWYDKQAIFQYQKSSDVLITNESLRERIEKIPSVCKKIFVYEDEYSGPIGILGLHNKANASLAAETALALNIPAQDIEETLANFSGLPFRQENIGKKDSVIFVNDSTSTTPISLQTAIQRFSQEKIYLIAGGNSKLLPWEFLVEQLQKIEKIFWLQGSWSNEVCKSQLNRDGRLCSQQYMSMEKAVQDAYKEARKTGGVVLLSPGATSFATFVNEFDRGNQFNIAVAHILSSS